MRPVRVVVVDIDPKHSLELPAVHDQQPVEALGTDGADETLGDRVCLRRSHRRLDDLDPLAAEDRVELAGELAVAVADQEPKRRRPLLDCPGELAGLLSNQAPLGLAVQPASWTRRLPSSMKNST